jgi:monoamine oxidase
MGAVTKVVAIYDRPFWREAGWSGHFLRTEGAIRLGFDTSPPDGSYGQITAFAVGPVARKLLYLEPAARQEFYEREAAQLLGQKPRYLYQKSWTEEPWVGGCYVGFFGPGGWKYLGEALYQRLPSVWWAGTERSRQWMGYIEGALWAAEAAVEAMTR